MNYVFFCNCDNYLIYKQYIHYNIYSFLYNFFYIAMKKTIKVGIRREDKSVWERRVAIVPNDLFEISSKYPEIQFICQPSTVRIFSDLQYEKAGAQIDEDLSQCDVIIGVKEVSIKNLFEGKTYVFFSHVIKAQSHNMNMLDVINQRKIRLIDYEKISDINNNRLIAFGVFAGLAGAIDYLAGFGHYLLKAGYSTPFLNISYSYKYFDLNDVYSNLKKVSDRLLEKGIQPQLRPLIFAVTGRGKTANGVLTILKHFPVKIVTPDEIQKLVQNKSDPKHATTIYLTNINTQDVIIPRDQSLSTEKHSFYKNPEKYKNVFNKKYLPYISCLFHCIYWDSKFPKYIKNKHLARLASRNNLRLIGICDVTCDAEGSIQCLKDFTSPDRPFFFYDPQTQEESHEFNYKKNRIMYLALDFLPCELAYDASKYFSGILKQWISNICFSDGTKPLNQQGLVPQLQKAVITCHGKLTERFQYITGLREQKSKSIKNPNLSSIQVNRIKNKGEEKGQNDLTNSLSLNNIEVLKIEKVKPTLLNFQEDQ